MDIVAEAQQVQAGQYGLPITTAATGLMTPLARASGGVPVIPRPQRRGQILPLLPGVGSAAGLLGASSTFALQEALKAKEEGGDLGDILSDAMAVIGMGEGADVDGGIIGALGGGGVGAGLLAGAGTLAAGGLGLLLSRLKFPWETPTGEGFIMPWTEQVPLNGLWGVEGKPYPGVAGQIPGALGAQVAYSWNTGTAVFYRLTDGRIAVQRKNGVWKVYRPKKHIVVPSNPRIGTLTRAMTRIDRLSKKLAKKLPKTRRVTPVLTSKYLSAVERAAIK